MFGGMNLRLGLGLNNVRTGAGGTPTPTPAPISAMAADGWQSTMASPTDVALTPFSVSRQGFDATGTATTITDTFYTGKRVRQPYPSQGSFTATSVALTDYMYSTDSATGVTNNSTEISPKPVCAWVMPARLLTGNTVHWEIIAFHRDFRSNRQVACVKVRANDGTNQTAWQTVATTSISTLVDDPNPIEVYQGDLTLTGITDGGEYWLEAEVYPFIGADNATYSLSSVRKTEGENTAGATAREFGRRYFLKDTARAAAPPLAYVSSTGNDTTGVWSTNAATASATPYLTVGGALQGITAAGNTAATGSKVDGCEIRVVDTVNIGAVTTARTQNLACPIITRAPGTTRANAIITLGASLRARFTAGLNASTGGEGAILFKDMSFNRTLTSTTIQGEAANFLDVALWNVNWTAQSGVSANHLSSAHIRYFGLVFSGAGAIYLNAATANQIRLIRGVTVDMQNVVMEQFITIGSSITRSGGPATRSSTTLGGIVYNNKFLNPNNTPGTQPINFDGNSGDGNVTITGIVIWQNLIEDRYTNTASKALAVSSDAVGTTSGLANTVHTIVGHNTVTGYGSAGRFNLFYDTNDTLPRTHKLHRIIGNILPQINVKGDVFFGVGGGTNPETRLGHFAFHHGVGCQGNFAFYKVNSGTALSEEQAYAGPGTTIGTSATDPVVPTSTVFTAYAGPEGSAGSVTNSGGTGGGTYTLASGSPAKNIVTQLGCAYDLAGSARGTTTANAGAYAG